MPPRPPKHAPDPETLALLALAHIAGDEALFARFFALSGLDEASLRFRRVYGEGTGRTMDPRVHGVFLVLGNGEDIVSDWNYSTGDPDGFNTAMEAFDPTELL